MYLTPCLDPSDILHIWIGYSFEYAPLVLKCCYCNVFDHVYLEFLKCLIFVFDSETINKVINPVLNDSSNTWESRLIINNNNTWIVDSSNQLEH